jgi:hypothetical protein
MGQGEGPNADVLSSTMVGKTDEKEALKAARGDFIPSISVGAAPRCDINMQEKGYRTGPDGWRRSA